MCDCSKVLYSKLTTGLNTFYKMSNIKTKKYSYLTWPCHAQCKIIAELGWFPRKIGIRVEMSSWRKVCQEVLICSKANTSMSGQCLIGKLKSCLTCSYCPTSASLRRDSIKSKLFLTRMKVRYSVNENIKYTKIHFPSK